MPEFDQTSLIVVVMVVLCAAGLAWVFIYPHLSGEARAEKRMARVSRSEALPAARRNELLDAQKRRRQVQETLTELEAKQKRRARPTLRIRLQQAGLSLTPQAFMTISAALGAIGLLGTVIAGLPILVGALVAIVAGVGLPHWGLNYLTKRRQSRFLLEFPNSIDVVVRGVKAGLPLHDCLRMVAAEAQQPVREEFRQVVETQAIGLPLADCVERMYDRMPLPEVNFFAIVIAIQQKSGGNLSEVLSNLSRVLRDRKKMKQKIQAMSQEAKASAAIIGALPIIVMVLVFLTSPDYISLLWSETVGHIMLAGSALWMTCGVLVMRKMINFDF